MDKEHLLMSAKNCKLFGQSSYEQLENNATLQFFLYSNSRDSTPFLHLNSEIAAYSCYKLKCSILETLQLEGSCALNCCSSSGRPLAKD